MSAHSSDQDEEYDPFEDRRTSNTNHKKRKLQRIENSDSDIDDHHDNQPLLKKKKPNRNNQIQAQPPLELHDDVFFAADIDDGTEDIEHFEQQLVAMADQCEMDSQQHNNNASSTSVVAAADDAKRFSITTMPRKRLHQCEMDSQQHNNNASSTSVVAAQTTPNDSQSQQCRESDCNTLSICPMYLRQFDIFVCKECKFKPHYKCITKTTAKTQYLLSDGDVGALKCWIKATKAMNHMSTTTQNTAFRPRYMKLFLTYQIEQLSIEKWGSLAGIEEERKRREINRMQRAISSARKKRHSQSRDISDIKIDERVIQKVEQEMSHTHQFGEAQCVDSEIDQWSKTCTECGYEETWEEF
eukprot:CAMPEP_0202727710 /NCGR_PEP_ID=MMETSP1385-20130828/185261_1 /ASSEMBLY_ACC=CAM_ASM_000861 /TAXON_ID=933848 /ORGANISM="Elphidium margaritaceum" /LENGTH=355 /DNA_ID=CAMNT_0049393953 /DNA_START=9 /DNA_END=1075 /DNA_ORIENTATION=-